MVFAAVSGSGLAGGLRLGHPDGLSREEGLELVRAAASLRAFAAALEAVGVECVRAGFEADPETTVAPGGGPVRFGGDAARALAVSEVAAAQGVSDAIASRTLTLAESLGGPLRPVREMLAAGKLSEGHARVVAQQADGLTPDEVEDFVRFAMARLRTRSGRFRTVHEFRPVLVRLRERVFPVSVTKRRARAAQDRGVWFRPEPDGMCTLSAFLPAEVGVGLYAAIDSAARSHRTANPEDPRTLAQLRADAFVHSALTGTPLPSAAAPDETVAGDLRAAVADGGVPARGLAGAPAGIPDSVPDCSDADAMAGRGLGAKIVVLIPANSLLGGGEEPATLDGYGPLDPGIARRLAAAVPSWERMVTDFDGAPLMLGRTSYRPTAAMRRFVGWRDGACVFPGCTTAASRADLDHTVEWADGGPTDVRNLAALCPKHHALKSLGHWSMEQATVPERASAFLPGMLASRHAADAADDTVTIAEGTGFITWTSPMGRTYTTAPAEYDHGPEDDFLADALSLPPDPRDGAPPPAVDGWDERAAEWAEAMAIGDRRADRCGDQPGMPPDGPPDGPPDVPPPF